MLALARRFLRQPLLLRDLDIGQTSRARDRVAAKGREVLTRLETVGDLCRGNGGAQGETVGDPLGQDHDVRLDSEVLDGEGFSGASEARLHLVGDEEDAVTVENLLHPPEVARRGYQNAPLTHNRLGDEGGDVPARLVVD